MIKKVNPQNYATSVGNGWYLVSIPLSALEAANTTVNRLTIQDNTGSAQPTFHVDEVKFIAQ
jgi:hypothetical protein